MNEQQNEQVITNWIPAISDKKCKEINEKD